MVDLISERLTLRSPDIMKSILAVLIMLGTSAGAAPKPEAPSFRVGQTLPDLSLPRISDGQSVSIKSIVGQRYIVHLFASW